MQAVKVAASLAPLLEDRGRLEDLTDGPRLTKRQNAEAVTVEAAVAADNVAVVEPITTRVVAVVSKFVSRDRQQSCC